MDFQHDDFRRAAEAERENAASQSPRDEEGRAVQLGPGIGEFGFLPGDVRQRLAAGQADLAAVGMGANDGVRRAGGQQGEDVRHVGEQDVGNFRGEAQRQFLRPDPEVVVIPHGRELKIPATGKVQQQGIVPHGQDAQLGKHVPPQIPAVVLVMIALHGEDAQGGFQHLEVFTGRFRAHAAFPGVAVGVIPQQEDHVRLRLHDFFHVPARLVAAVRAQVEVSGDHDPERDAAFFLPLRHFQRGRDGFHAPGFHLPRPHE